MNIAGSKIGVSVTIAAVGMGMFATPTLAQRAETVSHAQVRVTKSNGQTPTCPLTRDADLSGDRERVTEFLGPLVATLFAGFAGDLVKSGVNALGDALDQASKERGFVAEGDEKYNFGQISKMDLPDPDTKEVLSTEASFVPGEHCLILYVPSNEGKFGDALSRTAITANGRFQLNGTEEDGHERRAVENRLKKLGLSDLPKVYIEALVIPGREALVVRPSFVWYRTRLNGAPKRSSATELHLSFATPGFDAEKPSIGSPFASARIKLPKMVPGTALGPSDLRGYDSIWLPLRPEEGSVKKTVEVYNAALTTIQTRQLELTKADRALEVARLATGDPAAEELRTAQHARNDASRALKIAVVKGSLLDTAAAGATNVQMRFVVVPDANKFGQAIAKALKSQAEAAGKGVTEGLTPKPEFASTDTAYLTAMITVDQNQRLYEKAVEEGDADKIATASDTLRISKAKANEAAVAASKPLPFPGILSGL